MVHWVAVPECHECGHSMTEDPDDDWQCPACGYAMYREDSDDE